MTKVMIQLKLAEQVKDFVNCVNLYVMNGSRALIKREKFERYPDQATAV